MPIKVLLFLFLMSSSAIAGDMAGMRPVEKGAVFLRAYSAPGELRFKLIEFPQDGFFVETNDGFKEAMKKVDDSISRGMALCLKILLGTMVPLFILVLCSSIFILGVGL